MNIKFNDYSMNKAALFGNGLQVVEHFGRFYVVKHYKADLYKLFFNSGSFDQAIEYASKM